MTSTHIRSTYGRSWWTWCLFINHGSPVRSADWSHTLSSLRKSNTRGCILKVHNVGNTGQLLAVHFGFEDIPDFGVQTPTKLRPALQNQYQEYREEQLDCRAPFNPKSMIHISEHGSLEGKRTMFKRTAAIPLHYESWMCFKSWASSQHMFHSWMISFSHNKERGFSLWLRPRFDSHMIPVKKCMLRQGQRSSLHGQMPVVEGLKR